MRSRVAFFLFLLLPSGAFAQPKTALPVAAPARLDYVIPVMAHQALCAAVSDGLGLLAFGHDSGFRDAHVSLVKLDPKGNPAAYTVPIKLPRPDSLAKFPSYTLSVVFHPKLPLLFVWQDIGLNYTNPVPPQPPDWDKFDHLHIFSLAKETPELVTSLCRGSEYIFGRRGGSIGVDATGSYLYVPNMRELKNAGSLRIGRFPLDAEGLPLLPEVDAKQPFLARGKRLAELNAAKPVSPPQLTPIEYLNLFNWTGQGNGLSMVPVAKGVVLSTNGHGVFSWSPDDKLSPVHGLPLRIAGETMLGVHPNLPVAFATTYKAAQADSFFRIDQVEGTLTLLPKQFVLGDARLSGAPVVLSKKSKLAVGGHYFVYLVSLDDKGFPVGEVVPCQVLNAMVRSLAYSEKFERLYVGVDLSK